MEEKTKTRETDIVVTTALARPSHCYGILGYLIFLEHRDRAGLGISRHSSHSSMTLPPWAQHLVFSLSIPRLSSQGFL
jgi:hypothetical protein